MQSQPLLFRAFDDGDVSDQQAEHALAVARCGGWSGPESREVSGELQDLPFLFGCDGTQCLPLEVGQLGLQSQTVGVLQGRELARMFAWMRPNDLIWNYWVNNYLLGNAPPAFDILYWNNDTTRLAAKLHADFLDLIGSNPYVNPGRIEVRGLPLDMSKVHMDTYVIGGLTDHITPWQGCYNTAKLFGERSTFVLANSGHIQSLLNPPGNPKALFWSGPSHQRSAEEWLEQSTKHAGSWWPHWLEWISARSGETRPAPAALGSAAEK